MACRNICSLAAAAALLLAGLSPEPAHAAKYSNIHCYGSTSMRAMQTASANSWRRFTRFPSMSRVERAP